MRQDTRFSLGKLVGLAAILCGIACGGGSQPMSPSGSGASDANDGREAGGGVQGIAGGFTSGGATGAGGVYSAGGAAGGVPGSGGNAGSSFVAPDAAPGTGGRIIVADAGTNATEVASPANCPAPPAGATADAVTAINAENAVRVAMGVPCATLVLTLCTAAQNHCNYYATNKASANCKAASAHSEVAGCPQFTGTDPGARQKTAGYSSNGWSENMSFLGSPAGSVKSLIDTVYHRIPILSPWWRDFGYGNSSGCDTMDFGIGAPTAKTVTAVYPYDGQIGVPLSFNGAYEGPMPPTPSTGWPSGYPITLYGQGITVTKHQIVVDGTTTALKHVWLDGDATTGPTAKVLYTEAPLTVNTTYRVTMDGTTTVGSAHFDWRFTTGAGK